MLGTSVRQDVMNKTLFRAIRREFKNIFDAYLQSNKDEDLANQDFFTQISSFCQHYVSLDTQIISENIKIDDLSFYLALFVDFCKVKKISKENKEEINKFYEI
jgi:hypothetical protein